MFVCPKCGYKDESCWRSAAFKKYAVYCKLDELEVFRPELANKLREQNRIVDAIYVYRLSKNNFVYRLLKEFEVFYGSHGITEKPKLVDPAQKRLVVEKENTVKTEPKRQGQNKLK